jgi:enoyl-CoA hydratase/carnithine racemase
VSVVERSDRTTTATTAPVVSVVLHAVGVDDMCARLAQVGQSLTGAVRVVVLRSDPAGDFGPVDSDAAGAADLARRAEAVGWLRRPDLISVAAVGGRAIGAGLEVALACDLRIVSVDAELAVSLAPGALPTALGSAGRLVEAVGYSRALELTITGRRLSGRQAVELGLANLAVQPGDLDDAVTDLISAVLAMPRAPVAEAKALLSAAAVDPIRAAGNIVDETAAAARLHAGQE